MGKCRIARCTLVLALLVGVGGSARAEDNDLVMSRLGTTIFDASGNPIDVVGSNLAFRSLASELGVLLAPRLLTPADTLGFGGFQFAVDTGFTGITNDADYWRALASSPDPTAVNGLDHGSEFKQTLGFFVRKGIWLPLPSFEVGFGAVHLLESNMWAAQGYAKFALHEGFHDLPLPSAAVRAGASRVMGSDQIDMSVASLDVSVSKDLGVRGTFTASPYAGWNLLWIVPRSEVIDKTPHIAVDDDRFDITQSFAFGDQDTISRHRLFAGLKLHYYVLQLTLEANHALAGSSVDDRPGTDLACSDVPADAPTVNCDAEDLSGAQTTYTVSLGLDF